MSALTKKQLTIDFDFDLELDFLLIGITSTLRDYRLCHFIFKNSGFEFVRGKESYIDHKGFAKDKEKDEMDFHIIYEKNKTKNSTKFHFATYRFCTDDLEQEAYIISNKSVEGALLIPELPTFDFFLLIKNYMPQEDIKNLLEELKRIDQVILAKELDPTALKSKENLIF